MTFPIITDYRTALRNAAVRFASVDVEPVIDDTGDPVFQAGNFAAVFKATIGDSDEIVALKCFTRDIPDLEHRHKAFTQLIQRTKSPFLVEIAFFPNELFITSDIARTGDYPVLVMSWAKGESLGAVIERFCAKERRKGLAALSRAWANMCLELLSMGIAHGDLKHDNILVTPDGKLRLIDYDSMFTPQLKGLKSVLLGGVNYQHPKRGIDHFDNTLDHFSMLVITLSLRALAIDPGLYGTFNTGENIIIGHGDFTTGARSPLFAHLLKSPDAMVRNWSKLLIKVSRSNSIAVQGLKRILQDARKPIDASLTGEGDHRLRGAGQSQDLDREVA